jgi:uncharacterized membrane protein
MKKIINIIVGLIGLIAQVISVYYGIACTAITYSNVVRYLKVGMFASIITIICIIYLVLSNISVQTQITNQSAEESK